MKKFIATVSGIILFLLLLSQVAIAQTTSSKVIFPMTVWVACANQGTGELASGNIELNTDDILSQNPGNPYHPTAELVGACSGTVYELNGPIRTMTDPMNFQLTYLMHVVGSDGAVLMLQMHVHTSLSENGQTTAEIENIHASCKYPEYLSLSVDR